MLCCVLRYRAQAYVLACIPTIHTFAKTNNAWRGHGGHSLHCGRYSCGRAAAPKPGPAAARHDAWGLKIRHGCLTRQPPPHTHTQAGRLTRLHAWGKTIRSRLRPRAACIGSASQGTLQGAAPTHPSLATNIRALTGRGIFLACLSPSGAHAACLADRGSLLGLGPLLLHACSSNGPSPT